MGNINWSEKVQSIYSLDTSKDLRFTDKKMKEIIEVTRIGESKNILEVGCGPGTFTRKLKKELSEEIKITGLDMDGKFIEYCREIGEKELIGLINDRYKERLKLLDNGERLWDFSISPMIVISGMK